MEELEKFFTNTKMFYIATIENNQPRVRPFGNIVFDKGCMFINTGRTKHFYQQVKENPHIEICAFEKGTWFRVQALVEECKEKDILKKTVELDPFVKKNYQNRMEELVILELKQVKAYRCQFDKWNLVYEETE